MQLLIFTLGGDNFGIPLKEIGHIESRSDNITELPAASAYIKGITTIRGDVVPIYNLASRFGYTEKELKYSIIVNMEGMKLIIEADSVKSVINTEEAEVLPLPLLLDGGSNYLKNIIMGKKKSLIILLDIKGLLSHEERKKINHIITENM